MKRWSNYTQAQVDILRYVFHNGTVSRAELAEALKISNLTVINGVKRLLEDGMLAECGTLPSERGRRVTLLSVNPELRYYLSVDIGAFSTKLAVVRFDGSIVYREQHKRTKGVDVFNVYLTQEELREHIEAMLAKFGKARFGALCFCISGTVDYAAKRCLFCSNIQGWNNVDFQKEFGDYFQMPVYLDSSGHCAAMAERQFGKAKGLDDLLYVSVGTSICTGIVMGGQLLRGFSGAAGEFGHIQLENPAPLGWDCTCGKKNCLEMYATFSMIRRQIYAKLKNKLPGWDHSWSITYDMAKKVYDEGNPAAIETVEYAGRALGQQIANLANLLNPRMIILGGGTIHTFPMMVDVVQQQVEENSMQIIKRELTVEHTALGADAPVLGAALLAIYEMLDI